MEQDFVCPVMKAKEEEEIVKEVPVATTETSYTPDEGTFQIGNFKVTGLRTFIVVFLIIGTYCYLALQSGSTDTMKDLALMACGFIFGAKTIKR